MKKIIILAMLLSLMPVLSLNSDALELIKKLQEIEVPKPAAKIVKFDIGSISLSDINFLFDVAVTNPYPVKLTFSTLKATFSVENKQFFKTQTDALKIKAKGTETTRLFVNVKYEDMAKIVKNYMDKDSLECVIDVVIILPLPEFAKSVAKDITFKYQVKANVPTIKPEISIANFTVIKPTKKQIEDTLKRSAKKNLNADAVQKMFGAIIDGEKPSQIVDPSDLDLKLKVNFNIVMKNKTKAGLFFKDLNYTFNVNGSKLVGGYTKNIQNKQSEYILKINNEFSSRAFGEAILKAFREGKGDYSLTGFSMVKFPDKIKKEPLKLNFDEKGIFNIK